MKLLTALNLILPALGDHVVTRVDARHPTLAVILPVIELKLSETLLRGWWFNEDTYTMYPDAEGEIPVPTTTLAFIPTREYKATVRDGRLYNRDTRNFIWPGPVTGTLQERLEFEELPESVATYVFYSALVQAYLVDIGLEQIVAKWEGLAQIAEFSATAEHLRNKRHSTKNSARYGRYISALRS